MLFSFNAFNHSTYYDLPPSLPAQIEAAARAGYDRIGLDLLSLLAHERDGLPATAVADALAAHELPCHELVSLSLSADPRSTARSLDHVLRLAPAVGAREILTVVTGPVDDTVTAHTRDAAQRLADIGLGLSVEFLPTRDVDSIAAARHLLDRVAHPNLRMVVESWHFFRGPSTWQDLDELPCELIGFVQFSDAPPPLADPADLHHESMHRRVMPGEGVFDLDRFCRTLTAKGFDGVVSVELLSDTWRNAPLDDFARTTLVTTRRAWALHANAS